MSNCMYTAQGIFVCNEESNKETIEHFDTLPLPSNLPTDCNECKLSTNNILSCKCKAYFWGYSFKKNTSLNYNNCNNKKIINNDGILYCR